MRKVISRNFQAIYPVQDEIVVVMRAEDEADPIVGVGCQQQLETVRLAIARPAGNWRRADRVERKRRKVAVLEVGVVRLMSRCDGFEIQIVERTDLAG